MGDMGCCFWCRIKHHLLKIMIKIGRNDPCPCGSGKKYKKCCLGKPERMAHETLNKFFGKDWIKKELGKVKLSGYKNLNPMNLAELDIHPVIKAIIETQMKLGYSEQMGKQPIRVGRAEILQTILHKNLTILESGLDFPSTQRRLRDKAEYPKIEYEIMVAAGYRRLGYKINFIKPTSAKRSGEFYVANDSNQVLVECKRKDLLSSQEKRIDNWWEEFQHLVMKKIDKLNKCFAVLIQIPNDVSKEDTSYLLKKISNLLTSESQGEFSFMKRRYVVTMEKFCNYGGRISVKDFNRFDGYYDKVSSYGIYSKKHSGVEKPRLVGAITLHEDYEQKIRSIISTISDAYGQLEDNKPNIVYIDINISSMLPERSRKLLEYLEPSIEKKLTRDFSKISVVVLTNLKLIEQSGFGGAHIEESVIFNSRPRHSIAEGFKILGDRDNGKSFFKDIKEIAIKT